LPRVQVKILARAIEEPLRQIVTNAGDDAAVVLNRVREGKGNFGYNAANAEFGDMIELGILDPTKVTRLALQNAASVAGLFLTTEASIAEAPKKEKAQAAGAGRATSICDPSRGGRRSLAVGTTGRAQAGSSYCAGLGVRPVYAAH
jgi:hypothetical protein